MANEPESRARRPDDARPLDPQTRELAHIDNETARARFLEAIRDQRAPLHRYCTRMLGSSLDGEDVVQDTLAAAYFRIDSLDEDRPLAPYLFRVAHNRCIDVLRRRRFEGDNEPDDALLLRLAHASGEPPNNPERTLILEQQADLLMRELTLRLPPRERSCFVLKEVLDLSLQEIADVIGCKTGAVKSALHRARTKVESLSDRGEDGLQKPEEESNRELFAQFAELFSARDWAGVAKLLAEDVHLDVVGVLEDGTRDAILGKYTGNYSRLDGRWRLCPGRVDGELVLLCERTKPGEANPRLAWPIRLEVEDGQVVGIRDYVIQAPILAEAFEVVRL